MLNDNVWRLEKISKDGAFHKRLASKHINTVQEFLKLFSVDPPKLRRVCSLLLLTIHDISLDYLFYSSIILQQILGAGMSHKKWEAVIKHARTCIMGNKVYIFHGSHFTVILNPICQVVKAIINGQIYANSQELSSINQVLVSLSLHFLWLLY